MKINGNLTVSEGGKIVNLTLPSGNAFPENENEAELFVLTADIQGYQRGMYAYDGTLSKWRLKADMDTVVALLEAHASNTDLHVDPWPQIRNRINADEVLVVKDGYQIIVHDKLTVEGILDIHGEVRIQ